jgi:hypothetical protein
VTWPPRWTEPHFKQPGSAKVRRGLKREARENREDTQKGKVRNRDKYCRFPLCGCKRFGLHCETSHRRHKGMGGNPKEDRSDPADMVYLCSARHQSNVFAVDRKSLRWRPLTEKGAHGPIAWDIKVSELRRLVPKSTPLIALAVGLMGRDKWFELARETGIHVYEPMTPEQTAIVAFLKGMEV